MPNIDLLDDEYAVVVAAVRKVLDLDKYPMSPRLGPLKAALAKVDPSSVPKPLIKRPHTYRKHRCATGVGTGRGDRRQLWSVCA